MEDIYSKPSSNLIFDEYLEVNKTRKIISSVLSVVALLIYFGLLKFIPYFMEMFGAFGAELPPFTIVVLKSYEVGVFTWLAIFSFAPFFLWSNFRVKYNYKVYVFRYSLINVFTSFVVGVLTIWSLYLPIFQMGSSAQ